MEKSKTPPQSDAVRLKTILDLLQISGNKLSKILGYKSAASVYHVLEERNTLSSGMIEGIVKKFPQANYIYLKTGKGEPILTDESKRTAQQNLFGSIMENREIPNEQINQAMNRPASDPLTYNVATQLQMIIDNTSRTNRLLEKLVENQNEMLKVLVDNE
jgi:ribonuclease D